MKVHRLWATGVAPLLLTAVACDGNDWPEAVEPSSGKAFLEWEKRPDGSFVALDIFEGAPEQVAGIGWKCWPAAEIFRCLKVGGKEGEFYVVSIEFYRELPSEDAVDGEASGNIVENQVEYSCSWHTGIGATEDIKFRGKVVKSNSWEDPTFTVLDEYAPPPWDRHYIREFAERENSGNLDVSFDCNSLKSVLENGGFQTLLTAIASFSSE